MAVLISHDEEYEIFQAKKEECFYDDDGCCNFNFKIVSYGATKSDVVVQLKSCAKVIIKNLQSLIDDETIGV